MNTKVELTNLIKQQLKTGDVLDEQVLALYQKIPRHAFVPNQYQSFAYSDMQIELAHGQRMMTPLEEAKTLQALRLTGRETVLEIGTGTGFFTALLSQLCKKVISVDYFEDFTRNASVLLQQYECNNVELYTGDATDGWGDKAPYDVIVFTGSIPSLTESHRLQIVPRGRIFAITGTFPVMRAAVHHLDADNHWSIEPLFETCLPPLINPNKTESFVF